MTNPSDSFQTKAKKAAQLDRTHKENNDADFDDVVALRPDRGEEEHPYKGPSLEPLQDLRPLLRRLGAIVHLAMDPMQRKHLNWSIRRKLVAHG